jgi:hypothetical protein
MKKSFKIICALFCVSIFTNAVYADDKLIFALDLIRHGDRTPAFALPKSTYHWPEGIGQLTAKGMQQEYDLGKKMRERYITTTHLLPDNFSSTAMFVRSSDYNRTLMSAESFLYGLYPLGTGPGTLPRSYQPIPIHTVPEIEDDLLVPNYNQAFYDDVMEKNVFNLPDWQAKTALYQHKFAQWSAATGMPIRNLQDLLYLADNLYVSQLYNVPMPNGISKEDAADIIAAGSWAFLAEMKAPAIWHLTGPKLLGTITNYLKNASLAASPLKYVLLAAHDSTIMSLLSTMQSPVSAWPPYASDINFLLYESPNKTYYVKITYNDQPVNVPACGGDICSLAVLAKLAESQ